MSKERFFETATPVGVRVRCTRSYWEFIVGQKHPSLKDRERDIVQVLEQPDEVRRSRKDPRVLLYYRRAGSGWLCAVVRRENGTGFLITAYPTDAIKIGSIEWTRSS